MLIMCCKCEDCLLCVWGHKNFGWWVLLDGWHKLRRKINSILIGIKIRKINNVKQCKSMEWCRGEWMKTRLQQLVPMKNQGKHCYTHTHIHTHTYQIQMMNNGFLFICFIESERKQWETDFSEPLFFGFLQCSTWIRRFF